MSATECKQKPSCRCDACHLARSQAIADAKFVHADLEKLPQFASQEWTISEACLVELLKGASA